MERVEVRCQTCPKHFKVYLKAYENNRRKEFHCNRYCQYYFRQFADRRQKEHLAIFTKFHIVPKKLGVETRKKLAFVRLLKIFSQGRIPKEENNKILHHINNGHTFMAYLSLNQRKKNG